MSEWLPTKSAEIVRQQLGNETLLLDGQGKTVHVLNVTADVIWKHCDGSHTSEQIERVLREQFSMSAETTLTQDVNDTLNLLRQKGLIH